MSDPPQPQVQASGVVELIRGLPAAASLLARLESSDSVWVVGGAVRDAILGKDPADLDIAVEGDAAALARRIGGPGAVVRAHGRFGTATVELDGRLYDIAATRRERYRHPGALPDVRPAGIDEDLGRRDFTVNAVAVALSGPRTGQLIAVPHALEDLSTGVLRALHDGSFGDDPTRLYRLARYVVRLGFTTEPRTAELAREAVRDGAVGTISGMRLGTELRLLAREPRPAAALAALAGLGLAEPVGAGFGLDDDRSAALERALGLLPADGRRELLALAAAVLGVDPAARPPMLTRLGFAAAEREVILTVAGRAAATACALAAAGRPSSIAAILERAPVELAALGGGLGIQTAREAAARWIGELRHVRPRIGASDLVAAGVPRGPALGRGLRGALAARLDGQAPTPDDELAAALRAARPAE